MSGDRNPEINKDSQRSRLTENPDSWSSPVHDADSGFRFDQSDIHPERKARLKDYLSDTSKADSANEDVTSTLEKSDYSIDNGEGDNSHSFEKDVRNSRVESDRKTPDYEEAFRMFRALSHGHTFTEDQNADLKMGKHTPGRHSKTLANQRTAVHTLLTRGTGRWAAMNDTNFNFGVDRSNDDTPTHRDTEAKWQNYFSEKIGEAAEMKEKYRNKDRGFSNPFYGLESDPTMSEIDNSSVPSDSEFLDELGEESAHHAYSSLTYGMNYNHGDRFINSHILPNDAVYFALDLLELYLQGVIISNIGNLLQVVAATLGGKNSTENNLVDTEDISLEPWDNIYGDHPRFKNPTQLRKGTSSWNGDTMDHFGKHETEYAKFIKGNVDDPESYEQLLEIAKDDALRELSHGANIASELLRKIDVHIPKHTLQNMRTIQKDGIFNIGKNIVLAYNGAALQGFSHLAIHSIIHGTLDFRDRGFFRNLTRNLFKNRSYLKNFCEHGSWTDWRNHGHATEHFLGEGQKIIAFFNYCVQIGDLSVVQTPSSHASVSENKVPLDMMHDHPSIRVAKYRRHATNESTFSMKTLPSLYLYPNGNLMGGMAAMNGEDAHGFNYMGSQRPIDENSYGLTDKGTLEEKTKELIKHSQFVKPSKENRFSPETVRKIEDALEAEQMPFYIQDLRTNEIISFHAFLTELSDSYSASWTAAQGFGRMEAAQIYGGGSRSIGVGFTMVSFNEEDFNEMWWKINKLTTMVYPQWSRGTKLDYRDGELDGTIIQPFSQVPTASPLCRLRVGDVFTSNYSEQNVARLFGVGSETSMKYKSTQPNQLDYLNNAGIKVLEQYHRDRNLKLPKITGPIEVTYDSGSKSMVYKQLPILRDISQERFDSLTYKKVTATEVNGNISISEFFKPENNPIIRSFNSNRGRGIAVAVTGLTFAWKYGEVPWNAEPGSRAPRQCDVSMTIIPIHDITPGLDHNGINRAPIYGVGEYSSNMKGDPHYKTPEYNEKMQKISRSVENHLRGGHE